MSPAPPLGPGGGPGARLRVRRSFREDQDTPRIVDAAIRDFQQRFGGGFTPLLVAIAALNEEPSLGPMLDEVPRVIDGQDVTLLVIDDGSTDRTTQVARAHGALVCRLERNCGHGAALRAGYRLAREHGARYVATLDADGQWDPASLPAMVRLLVNNRADFVIGSRQLGRTENTDALRNAGVRFFSALISLLTRTRITDSSSGLRVMRVEMTGQVRQTQPQYQTSELLIGAIFQGFRVVEVPTVMRVRTAGESKKGRNVLYGARYATVILRTFLREWPARVRARQT